MCLIHRCTQAELDKVTGMPLPKVADKDITVFKLLVNKERGVYEALFHSGTYEKGWHYYQVPDGTTNKNGFSIKADVANKNALILTFRICAGLHSYREKPKKNPYNLSKTNLEWVEMFIPEGALYYEGDNGVDLVSNELIYADKDKMPYEEWDDEEEGFVELPTKVSSKIVVKKVAVPAKKSIVGKNSIPAKKIASKPIKAAAKKKQVSSPKKPIKKTAIKKVIKPIKKKVRK